jgi:hypothetical protein
VRYGCPALIILAMPQNPTSNAPYANPGAIVHEAALVHCYEREQLKNAQIQVVNYFF